jgi:hypothetical protein
MSSVIIKGDTSGQIALSAPAVAGTNTLTLPTITGTVGVLVSGTAVASTSGTSIDFTSIPAGVRRITVMFNGVSSNGASSFQIQIGSGSVTTTGYVSSSAFIYSAPAVGTATTGFLMFYNSAGYAYYGTITLCLLSGNTWVSNHTLGNTTTTSAVISGGGISPALGGVLDRVRITTVNGTDTFDAGSINILYE